MFGRKSVGTVVATARAGKQLIVLSVELESIWYSPSVRPEMVRKGLERQVSGRFLYDFILVCGGGKWRVLCSGKMECREDPLT